MHKSRLGGLIIDCETEDLDGAAEFWGKALGYETETSVKPEDKNYVLLRTEPDEPHVEVQQVTHPSRVHIDIETDDIDAEVERLEMLGAKRIGKVRDWWIMESPTGHRFCVVNAQRSSFDEYANIWE